MIKCVSLHKFRRKAVSLKGGTHMIAKREIHEQTIVISVDSYDDKVAKGRFWYGQEGCETKFTGLMQLLLLTEKALGEQKLPVEDRCKSFVRLAPAPTAQEFTQPADPTRGTLGTFRMRVLFRQNTSWQGLLTWVETSQEERFRSVLELATLIDSALTYASEEKNQ